MRAINGLFSLVLIVFAVVQYNDPDAFFWFVIYGLAAIWCGLAAFQPEVFSTHEILLAAFLISLVGAIAGTVYYWPSAADWWTKEVIWENELVREGIGMAIVTAGLLSVAVTWWFWSMDEEM